MEYRQMCGTKVSLLGFGNMRLPEKDGKIDREKALAMLDKAISSGVNYLDTAYGYHQGDSEVFVGEAIRGRKREDLIIATKLPMWHVDSEEKVDALLKEQLQRLGTPYIDFYLLHAMGKASIEKMRQFKVLERLEKYKKDGTIRHLGFSFHDDYQYFEELVKTGAFEFAQIQFNYMDKDTQAGLKGMQLAGKQGMGIVIMEPVKGGTLANLPSDVTSVFKQSNSDSPARWALRYAASFPEVCVVLSGMSTMEQVEENLDTFNNFKALNAEETRLVEEVAKKISSRTRVPCTACGYCTTAKDGNTAVCPFGVNIPRNFRVFNNYAMYENKGDLMWNYKEIPEAQRANKCTKCGRCELLCPQKIRIPDELSALEKLAA
jgi:predicted aldo/keto reductase-like oxidoreductase